MTVMSSLYNEAKFLDVIRERRSVRSYDPEWKIPREELKAILAEVILAPSSSNLQPWRFLILDSPELKQKLLPIANNQQQVLDASAVIAVLGDTESWRMAGAIYGRAAEEGYMPADTAASFTKRMEQSYGSLAPEAAKRIVTVDGGLVSMQLMLVARAYGYDTVPMGGYDAAKFKEAFGIGERYVSIMLIAIGKAAKPGHPTVRLSVDEVSFWNEMPS